MPPQIITLTQLPDPSQARSLLTLTSTLATPILTSHNLPTTTLSEFLPQDKILLATSTPSTTYIRLRRANDISSFLPVEECVYTLLHQAAHTRHPAHDQDFYHLLKSLEEEYAATSPPPPTSASRRGRIPLERVKAPVGIRQKIAAATERRIRDAHTCGVGRGREGLGSSLYPPATVAEDEDEETERAVIEAAIELIAQAEAEERLLWGDDLGSSEGGTEVVWIIDGDDHLPIQVEVPTTPAVKGVTAASTATARQVDMPPSYEEATTPTWECEMCTLVNPVDLIRCEACSFEPDPFSLSVQQPSPPPTPQAQPKQTQARGKQQKVRFVDTPMMIPEKETAEVHPGMWSCENCTLANDDEWCCAACGVEKLTS